ncbi:MAG: noncanonical pyrimidine nucleotidase, YjjG family [Verrucomicrobia bacterium]|nr:MAG: noncanonical pyrimidine nucleotidase, YjjG family [Verrucomicrobiota bacterium]
MQRYKWLLFDADGTLFDYERAESSALKQVFESLGARFEPVYLGTYQRINNELWLGVEKGKLAPDFVKMRRFELLLEEIGNSHAPGEFALKYLECLADCSELIEGAAETLRALHGKYRMAILTNGLHAVQRRRLERSVIRPHIADIIISEEIGSAKPAKEFFDAAFLRLEIGSPGEALMVGDGWNSDIMGAMQYGLDACWYNPGRKPRPNGSEVTREISSLNELAVWLG